MTDWLSGAELTALAGLLWQRRVDQEKLDDHLVQKGTVATFIPPAGEKVRHDDGRRRQDGSHDREARDVVCGQS